MVSSSSNVSGDATGLEFGPALRKLRQERRISQNYLAQCAGITRTTLSLWENDRAKPRAPEFQAVLAALKPDPNERRALLSSLEGSRAARRLHRVECPSLPFLGGDLLWSMRRRKGWTQTETARAVGVQQAQIARWERGDTWPDAERLHALCWHLGAHAEEAATLSLAASSTASTVPGDDSITADLRVANPEARSKFDAERWRTHLHTLLYIATPKDNLLDLTLLTVEGQLGGLAEQHAAAAPLLPSAYAVHARLHLNEDRVGLASHWAARGITGLNNAFKRSPNEFSTMENGVWFGNLIVLSAEASVSGSRAARLNAITMLKQWLPVLPRRFDGHRAWGLSTIARLSGENGCLEEAAAALQEACSPENSPHIDDEFRRQLRKALVLLESGFHTDASYILEECRGEAASARDRSARDRLGIAEMLFERHTRRLTGKRHRN